MSNPTIKPASAKQLRYLRALAQKTGTTFTPPASSREASREINRMRGLARDRDPRERQPSTLRYGTAPDSSEITGYGIRAHWRHTPPPKQDEPQPSREGSSPRRVRAHVIATHEEEETHRKLLSIPAGQHRLLIDRPVTGKGRTRLLARLDPDEPPENERLIARMYLADPNRSRCRALSRGDLDPRDSDERPASEGLSWQAPLIAGVGAIFQIRVPKADRFPALRWVEAAASQDRAARAVSLRCVVARLEDYQPAATITEAAIRAHEDKPDRSVALLRAELTRLQSSQIVLNRRLRERVQQAVQREGVTMSEIAMRCGRTRNAKHGRLCGETSWLARRIGLLPEAGYPNATPWVHTDVLALIARDGLGIAPAEAEVTFGSS